VSIFEKGDLIDFVGWITMKNDSWTAIQNAEIKDLEGNLVDAVAEDDGIGFELCGGPGEGDGADAGLEVDGQAVALDGEALLVDGKRGIGGEGRGGERGEEGDGFDSCGGGDESE